MLIEDIHQRLFEDVGQRSGISIIRGSCFEGLEWGLHAGPLLDKELLRQLDTREGDPSVAPYYLRELWQRATSDPVRGPDSVRFLRQLLLFAYKAELRHTHDQEVSSHQKWQDLNQSCLDWRLPNDRHSSRVVGVASTLVRDRIRRCEWDSFCPSHGPGAVTVKGSKSRWTQWFSTIESIFPYSEFFHTSTGFDPDRDDYSQRVSEFITCRAATVPKDSRGPRLVFTHPAEAVWVQQGCRRVLENAISRSQRLGLVAFDDQRTNQQLALTGSRNGEYGTLDLSDASDRLPDSLVQMLFGRAYREFGCCRATYADVGGHRVPIHMYAPMGNATTFPVESVAFWALSSAIQIVGGFSPLTYVLGDDIIVRRAAFDAVADGLNAFNLQVNQRKSFNKGDFRESCGVDAYRGHDVTPIRWKQKVSIEGYADLVGLSTLAARLRLFGYREAALELYHTLNRYHKRITKGRPLGRTNVYEHGAIAEYVLNDAETWATARWDANLQRFSTKVTALDVRETVLDDDWNHVLSSLTSLQRTGMSNQPTRTPSGVCRLKTQWRPVL